MKKTVVLLIWNRYGEIEMCTQGGNIAHIYSYDNTIVTNMIFGLDVLIDDIDDFYSMVKIQESREYDISATKLNKFDLIRESLLFFEMDPLTCKFITLNQEKFEPRQLLGIMNLVLLENLFFVLDIFCGGGGSAMGIHIALERSGIQHRLVGIDSREMPDYPFYFLQTDFKALNRKLLRLFKFIWTSPPCQAFFFL